MLIDVSLVDVLRSMLIAVPVVLFLAFILTLAKRIGANYLAAYLTAFVIVLALFFISSDFSQIAFFILLVIWLLPILPQIAYAVWETKDSGPDFWKVFWNAEPQLLFVDKSLSKQILLSLLISLLLISLSFILGSFEAIRFKPIVRYTLAVRNDQNDQIGQTEDGQYVFLRRYGNAILLRPISPEGKELSQSVMVKTFEQLSGKLIATERN